jgi:hypothetical protein
MQVDSLRITKTEFQNLGMNPEKGTLHGSRAIAGFDRTLFEIGRIWARFKFSKSGHLVRRSL